MNKSIFAKSNEEKNLFLCALRGLAVAVLSAVALAIVASIVCVCLEDPDKYIKIFALICLFVSAGAGGHIAARAKGKTAFLCGSVVGIMIIGVIALLCLIMSLPINMPLFAICAPTVLVTAILGAVTGVGKQQKPKKKKKKF